MKEMIYGPSRPLEVLCRGVYKGLEYGVISGGTLIFKWNEDQIPVSEVLKLAPAKTLLGNRSGQKTHWIVFYKGN